jgi:DNA processing protein
MARNNGLLEGVDVGTFSVPDLLGPLNEFEAKNAPDRVFAVGDVQLFRSGPRVSIVGARKATGIGLQRARKLAKILAEKGVVVVSGMAEGIDTAAQKAAVAAGGKSIGVLGCPLDVLFGQADPELRVTMMREHLVLSQFPSGHPVLRSNFPRRNRTMAILTHATVIVEASDTSGSLSQGWEALRIGRPLFLMQSSVDNPNLKWPSEMRDYGAEVLGSEDLDLLLEALPPSVEPQLLTF